jgi:ribosomal-protein-alanine acetyltransferase
MPLTIESALIRDLDKLCEIEKECFTSEAFTKQQIALLLKDYNSLSLVARENGKTIGFIIGGLRLERSTLVGHIVTIDVFAKHRRKGIGTRLLREIEEIFRERHVQECRLEVREDNARALRLYRKAGYVEIGKLKNYYGNAHGLCMRKRLT